MRRLAGGCALLLIFVAACGGSSSSPDAGGADAAVTPDAPGTPDATPMGDVTVTTYNQCCSGANDTPVAGVRVVAVQPDGSGGPTGMTDASGKITLSGVVAGASITAVYESGTSVQMVTTLDVQPGDDLVYGWHRAAGPPSGGGGGTLSLTFPAYTGATSYAVSTGCGNAYSFTSAGTVSVPESCSLTTAGVVVVAYDATGLIATAYLKDVPFTDGASATVSAWAPIVADGFSVSVTGLPDDASVVRIDGGTSYTGVLGYGTSISPTISGATATGTMTIPSDGDTLNLGAAIRRAAQLGPHYVFRQLAGDATSATFAAPALPWLSQLVVNSSAQLVTWFQVGDDPYDAAVAEVYWSRYDAVNNVTVGYDWLIEAPPSVTTWSWAHVPAPLADFVPVSSDDASGSLWLVDLAGIDGWDAARTSPEWLWLCPSCATQRGELPDGSSEADAWDGSFLTRTTSGWRAMAERGRPRLR